jgi:hypothetical protein
MVVPCPRPETWRPTLRRLLKQNDLSQPDDVEHRADGSIVALWHDARVAIVVEPEDLVA